MRACGCGYAWLASRRRGEAVISSATPAATSNPATRSHDQMSAPVRGSAGGAGGGVRIRALIVMVALAESSTFLPSGSVPVAVAVLVTGVDAMTVSVLVSVADAPGASDG